MINKKYQKIVVVDSYLKQLIGINTLDNKITGQQDSRILIIKDQSQFQQRNRKKKQIKRKKEREQYQKINNLANQNHLLKQQAQQRIMSQQSKQKASFLKSHPSIIKRLPTNAQAHISKLNIPPHDYNRIHAELYSKQQQYLKQLQEKTQSVSHQNQIFRESLNFYSPQMALQDLENQLSIIKEEDARITEQIQHCQVIQSNTTPEEYFLFKKNKRLQSFNQAMDLLFQEINGEKQAMKKFLQQVKSQKVSINKQIEGMQKELKKNQNDKEEFSKVQDRKQQSRIDFGIQQSDSQNQQNNNNQNEVVQSDSGSSVDYQQLSQLKQQYKTQLETYQIISQNKQIMTAQLFNNIESIQEGLNKYYEGQKTKLFRDITQIKDDFSYVPKDQLIQPTELELNYQISPLIHDYKNRLIDIGKKLSTDLKNITTEILTPLRWEGLSIDQYLDLSTSQYRRSTAMSKDSQKLQKDAKKQYQRLQQMIKKEDIQISTLESTLQDIMGQTMVYKQKQHQLQMAMNNMKKLLRQQR